MKFIRAHIGKAVLILYIFRIWLLSRLCRYGGISRRLPLLAVGESC